MRIGDRWIAVFRLGDRVFALHDACPHMGASLAEGWLDGTRVVCHWHEWSFDLETGRSGRESGACARVCRTRVDGGEVFVEPPEKTSWARAPAEEEEWPVWDDKFLRPPEDED